MQKYLYLEKLSFAETWVNGGTVPLNLASKYKNSERSGTSTPDENLIYDSPVVLESLEPFIKLSGDVRNLTVKDNIINGRRQEINLLNVSRYTDNGIILCLSNRLDAEICKKLGKSVCVKISNIHKLKHTLDRQIGVIGLAQKCVYTSDHRRNHFLKSELDSWQDEFRIFWKLDSATEVQIPRGIAEFVELPTKPK